MYLNTISLFRMTVNNPPLMNAEPPPLLTCCLCLCPRIYKCTRLYLWQCKIFLGRMPPDPPTLLGASTPHSFPLPPPKPKILDRTLMTETKEKEARRRCLTLTMSGIPGIV